MPPAQLEDSLRAALTIHDPETRSETLRMFAEILLVVLASREHELAMVIDDSRTTKELLRLALTGVRRDPAVVVPDPAAAPA